MIFNVLNLFVRPHSRLSDHPGRTDGAGQGRGDGQVGGRDRRRLPATPGMPPPRHSRLPS